MQKILIENVPFQRFTSNIEAESRTLILEVSYNVRTASFALAVIENDQFLINRLRLTSGTFLFRQFNFFTGDFMVVTSAEFLKDPTMGTWQNQTDLYYLPKEEIDALRI